MQLIEDYVKQFRYKTEAATKLGTSRQQLQQWCASTKPVYVDQDGQVYRKLN